VIRGRREGERGFFAFFLQKTASLIMKGGKKRRAIVLPLLETLKKMHPSSRVILLAHLDDQTRDAIYETIMEVLQSDKIPFRKRMYLRTKLSPFRSEFRDLIDKKKTSNQKKKKLMRIGGAPMSLVLKTAIPLLLQLFK